MGLLDRASTLIRANLNELLDRAEDPEKMIRQILIDMNSQLQQLKAQVAASIADEKKLHQRYQENEQKAAEWERKAELAVDRGNDALAREALLRRTTFRESAEGFYEQWQEQNVQVQQLKSALQQLERKIQEAEAKKDLLIARHRRAKAETNIRETLAGIGKTSAASEFARMEERVSTQESRAKAAAELETDTLDAQFAALESASSVDSELAALKARRSGGELPAGPQARALEAPRESE
jgi:phage shock protein A